MLKQGMLVLQAGYNGDQLNTQSTALLVIPAWAWLPGHGSCHALPTFLRSSLRQLQKAKSISSLQLQH